MASRKIAAVIFDLGGVVLTPGPISAIRKFESMHHLRPHSLAPLFLARGKESFARLEKGEIDLPQFVSQAQSHASELGLKVDVGALFQLINENLNLNPLAVDAIQCLRSEGIRVAALSNTWLPEPTSSASIDGLFDVIVRSAKVGMRKPEPEIYKHTLQLLNVSSERTVMLDDIGANLVMAKSLNMHTIKVDRIDAAITELSGLVGFPLKGFVPGTRALQAGHHVDPLRLGEHLCRVLNLPPTPPNIRKFDHGQSNPTFHVRLGEREFVVRKKPHGKLVPSAHAIEREYRIMAALHRAGIPVARPLHLCEDPAVIGTPFYVMEFVRGRVFKDSLLADLSAQTRTDVYKAMYKTLGAIHAVDPSAAGLADYGRTEGYVARQLKQWGTQYRTNRDALRILAMDELLEWLPKNIPAVGRPGIVHGDFRLDNLIFDESTTEVRAVLDWELSTLGDSLCDLAYSCLPYHLPRHLAALRGFVGVNIDNMGIPKETDVVADYCARAGIPNFFSSAEGRNTWAFYMAFSFFRLAAILHGVLVRARSGQASAANASEMGGLASDIAEVGWWLAQGRPESWTPSIHQATPRNGVASSLASGATARSAEETTEKLQRFMHAHVYPAEQAFFSHARSDKRWTILPLLEQLKAEAKAQGLWNLFIPRESDPEHRYGAGFTNEQYAHMCEIMGRSVWASEIFNCSAPDTGNMEVLIRYGTESQKQQFLLPLLNGDTRSCFAMTEPAVASSDATQIQASIKRDGDFYVINGRKWWISGAMDPRCKTAIFMGKTDPTAPTHLQQSMIIVPMDTPGVKIIRPMEVFGFDDAPHGHAEITFDDVRVPVANLLLGEGRGFEIAQGRLGPGRIHHCMRLIGLCERALELTCQRALSRVAFQKPLAKRDTVLADIAESRVEIEQARLLTLNAARLMDSQGNKAARKEIAMIKLVAPRVAQGIIDRAIQIHGAAGLSQDFVLAGMFSWARILRIADGPDEVHRETIAKMELKKYLSRL